jgi:hypothetical protein
MGAGTFGADPPACPEGLTEYLPYPSVVVTFFVEMCVCLVLSAVIRFRFNSVQMFNQQIKTAQISNTSWALYFLGISLSDLFAIVQYSIAGSTTDQWNAALLGLGFGLRGVVNLLLTYSLHHQWKYRCGNTIEEVAITTHLPSTTMSSFTSAHSVQISFKDRFRDYKERIDAWEVGYFVLLIVYWVSIIILFIFDYNDLDEGIFLIIFFLQQIPILILVTLIVLRQYGPDERGPLG